jgi:molybdopterin/thiamine biosynthesis adenylyltransferase
MVVLDLIARDPRVTTVTLVEPDVYKPHNVHRHLFPSSAVGHPKGELAAQWIRERRPDLTITVYPVDLTAAEHQATLQSAVAVCDVGVCAADNELAKYHFDQLMRAAGKPWTLGEVLSGGIGGWVHRFTPGGACYGCVASYLQRAAPGDPAAPPPDYSHPNGTVRETTIPATRASIDVIAACHAITTLDILSQSVASAPSFQAVSNSGTDVHDKNTSSAAPQNAPADAKSSGPDWTSLLIPLARIPGVFDDVFRSYKFRIPRSETCFVCGSAPLSGENLDAALHQALARLGDG